MGGFWDRGPIAGSELEEASVSARTKKYLTIILVAFALYAVYANPAEAANWVRTIFDTLIVGLGSVGEFFNQLLSG